MAREGSAATTPVVVAVDGTSGSGKSSTSRGVAQRLGFRYLDTGAMFRAVTWFMLEHGVDVHDADAVAARAEEPVLVSGTDPAGPGGSGITVDGHDVAVAIRGPEVTAAVSPVSTVPAVRRRLLADQRVIITDAVGSGRGIVVEGRDMGSVVWPGAGVKVYLTADPEARAGRRSAEQGGAGAEHVSSTGRTCCAATRSTPAEPPRRWCGPTGPSTSTPRTAPWPRWSTSSSASSRTPWPVARSARRSTATSSAPRRHRDDRRVEPGRPRGPAPHPGRAAPSDALLRALRPAAAAYFRRRWDVRVHGAEWCRRPDPGAGVEPHRVPRTARCWWRSPPAACTP